MTKKFSDDMVKFQKYVKERTKEITADFSNEMLATVTDRTPIDTGHAKESWHIQEKQQGMHYQIWNSAPYFFVLEYGLFPNPPKEGTGKTINGYSTQAPRGIVGVTMLEAPQIMEDVIKRK